MPGPAVRAVWCESAWLDAVGVCDAVRVEVDAEGYVTGVLPGVPVQEGDVVLHGVVFPAAANAHSHAFHRALRGRTHAQGGTFWTWRETMYRAAGALSPTLYEELATAVYAEMIVAGWTSVAEFHYVHHRPDGTPYGQGTGGPHAMELALARAAVRAGIRLTLLDTCYLAGGFGQPPEDGQRRFSDGTAERWLERLGALRETVAAQYPEHQVSVGAALHSVRAVPERDLAVIAGGLPEGLPLHIHLSEQPAENEDCLRATGLTPAGLLRRHGLVDERLSVVHATHATDEDIGLLGDAHAAVVLCPTTEADLADGLGPAEPFRLAGATLALGTDQHAVVDPWLEMRALEHGERLRTGRRGHFDPRLLHGIASSGGARAQGRRGGGLGPGSAADLMAIDPHTVRTAGSARDQLAYTATAQDVTAVVVGGVLMARNGVHTALGDPAALLVAAIARLDAAAVARDKPGRPGSQDTRAWERP
ncbi:formimidoylglutamate deiminase [Arthrobacter agilis]|uniref:formimidoylglutamate deiminase n=1 Tax=Arthrobacter agilis TaxID=37921 RepID=UPI000B34F607|nr:formimidoylglutamate deiminase [Arthrobacter agilis]OUM40800.1 formimidoylglutamate deiminase [Arthrobacter agilis]PPB45402.1 formimidoylglutamate deiminase [Arthrobacter agilis]TPV27747.1 formimidoylglutamate deiminase [Arthrobacter agilis]